eukprot:scaffold1340_cov122-Cylindrotheca_fusiformis.AAC.1
MTNPKSSTKEFTKRPSTNRRKGKKQQRRWKNSGETSHGQYEKEKEEGPVTKRSRTQQLPLSGMVVAVSTWKNETTSTTTTTDNNNSYSSVVQRCKELGAAEVLGQVGKRVQCLICTESAVQQATQRVRKAFQKQIPIIHVDWLKECNNSSSNNKTTTTKQQQQQSRAEMLKFSLQEKAKIAIEARKVKSESVVVVLDSTTTTTKDELLVPPPPPIPPDEANDDAGWTDAVDLG